MHGISVGLLSRPKEGPIKAVPYRSLRTAEVARFGGAGVIIVAPPTEAAVDAGERNASSLPWGQQAGPGSPVDPARPLLQLRGHLDQTGASQSLKPVTGGIKGKGIHFEFKGFRRIRK